MLLVLIQPIGPSDSKISGYFSTPEGNVHYSQVPDGTNTSGYIIVDNTGFTATGFLGGFSFNAHGVVQGILYGNDQIYGKAYEGE